MKPQDKSGKVTRVEAEPRCKHNVEMSQECPLCKEEIAYLETLRKAKKEVDAWPSEKKSRRETNFHEELTDSPKSKKE